MRNEGTREREGTFLRQQKLTLAFIVDPGGRGGDDPEFVCEELRQNEMVFMFSIKRVVLRKTW